MKSTGLKANLYIAAVAAVGAVLVGSSLRSVLAAGLGSRHLAWLGLAVLTLLAGRLSVRLPLGCCKVSTSDALVFASVWVFGTDLATVTGALDGFSSSARRGVAWYKTVFNTAALAISVNLASRLFWMTLPPEAQAEGLSVAPVYLLLLALFLAATHWFVNTLLVSVVVALKEGVSLTAIWLRSYPWAGAGNLIGSAAAALVFVAVRGLGVGSLIVIVPLPLLQFLGYRARLEASGVDGPAARKAAA